MPTLVNRKTGEAWDVPINKPATQLVNISMISKDNPVGESSPHPTKTPTNKPAKPVEEPKQVEPF